MTLFEASGLIFSVTEASTQTGGIPFWVVALTVVAVFAVPFGLGTLIAKMLKQKERAFPIGLILFVTVLGLTPFAWQVVRGKVEMRQYAAELAEWERKQQRFGITDEGVEDFKQALPDCEVRR